MNKMSYTSIGVIALFVLIIINFDVLKISNKKEKIPAHISYRNFLFSIMAYYLIDSFWGFFYDLGITFLSYIDTALYFVIMAFSVFFWTRYVINYLNEKNTFSKILHYVGIVFILFEITVIVVNIFIPIAFWFDAEDGSYHVYSARYINLTIQIVMYFITAVYMLIISKKNTGNKKHRYRTIGFFSLAMTIFIVGQAQHPFLPLYSVGCMLGTCLIHTFVHEDEKEERHNEIEKLQKKEIQQEKELSYAREKAYTDPLTGIKNKLAYIEAETKYNKRIEEGTMDDFGVIVFDLNGLKNINDTKGHDEGDQYIKTASNLICKSFKHSPVYRIGGDEFVAFLEGDDYKNSKAILNEFNRQMEENQLAGKVVISCGYEKFNPMTDSNFLNVFERADKKMYERKTILKSMV